VAPLLCNVVGLIHPFKENEVYAILRKGGEFTVIDCLLAALR